MTPTVLGHGSAVRDQRYASSPLPKLLYNSFPRNLTCKQRTINIMSSHRSSSTVSLSSTATTSSSSSSRTLTATPPVPKDYSAAFGTLQSVYGMSGCTPTPTFSSNATSRKQRHADESTVAKSTQSKDFEGAFGALASSYGFGGAAPSDIENTVTETLVPS
ncbi:hypothetical protein A0H81_13859 [Grifola frondosa]|uniref:Uncharacterized protein n=1 Tax=Grifola frondosa TaxID=5627 RepID=A0A1C7LU12_GRIFR|nr:hypothetical protein A0H81_13859 [Grifola frondosa]